MALAFFFPSPVGKQARGKLRTRNGPARPNPDTWAPRHKQHGPRITRELTAVWCPPEPEPTRCAALYLHREDWPRSATGEGELDALLDDLWAARQVRYAEAERGEVLAFEGERV